MRIGVLPEELLPADVAAKWHEMYTRALESGPFTVDYTTASGRVLLLSFNPVTHQGKVWGISTFGRDITEFRRAEQMQSRLERELIQAQKDGEPGKARRWRGARLQQHARRHHGARRADVGDRDRPVQACTPGRHSPRRHPIERADA